MIFGIRAVMEAIDSGQQIDKILIKREAPSALMAELMGKVRGTGVPVQRVPQEKLNQYTDKNHQGAIAFISPITFQHIEDIIPTCYEEGRVPLIMVLDGITDMRNLGAIARTCECAGVDALVVPMHGSAAINADAVKTSAGALLSLPVCRVESIGRALDFLAESGLQIVAATEHATQNYTEADMTAPVAIVMGSEDVGIDARHLDKCNAQVRIPMVGKIESLNVSVSAAIMIYEAIRQRG